jgi:hypothetical protein
MNNARKAGLLAASIFGGMGVCAYVWAVYWPNETSGFVLTFGLAILGLAFLMGIVQAIIGEWPS